MFKWFWTIFSLGAPDVEKPLKTWQESIKNAAINTKEGKDEQTWRKLQLIAIVGFFKTC